MWSALATMPDLPSFWIVTNGSQHQTDAFGISSFNCRLTATGHLTECETSIATFGIANIDINSSFPYNAWQNVFFLTEYLSSPVCTVGYMTKGNSNTSVYHLSLVSSPDRLQIYLHDVNGKQLDWSNEAPSFSYLHALCFGPMRMAAEGKP